MLGDIQSAALVCALAVVYLVSLYPSPARVLSERTTVFTQCGAAPGGVGAQEHVPIYIYHSPHQNLVVVHR
jgi:hypothetical protein